MRAFAMALVCLVFAVGAQAGDNPNVNIFLEFDNGQNYIDPVPWTPFTATVYLESFGPGGGTTALEFMLVRSFGGITGTAVPLMDGIDLGDPDNGWQITGSCELPDGTGRVAVAEVTYFYDGLTAGTLEVADHPSAARDVVDCSSGTDSWCVRLSPSGHAGVGVTAPPGDCPAANPCIEVTKEVHCDISKVGDWVSYDICIINCTDPPEQLYNVTVVDDVLGDLTGVFPTELAGDEVVCYSFDYQIQPGDDTGANYPDAIHENTVTVTAENGAGLAAPPDDATEFVYLIHPGVEVTKVCITPLVPPGGDAEFEITITNAGDCDLDIVTDEPEIAPFRLNVSDTSVFVVTIPDPGGVTEICNEINVTATIPPEYCDLPNVLMAADYDCCECFLDVHPHRWDVPSEAATIQIGINYAAIGDTVFVAAGTYSGVTNGELFPIVMKSGIVLTSESGAALTIVDASDTARVMQCNGLDATTVIEGITISHGFLSNSGPSVPRGAGMYCAGSSPNITDCAFTGNEANAWDPEGSGNDGAGLYSDGSSHPVVTGCTFYGNWLTGDSMGGSRGTAVHCGSAEFVDCTFDSNNTGGGTGEYALYSSYSGGERTVISSCVFENNDAGGAYVCSENDTVLIADCEFRGNSGPWYTAYVNGLTSVVSSCVFEDNETDDVLRAGGPSLLVTDCVFSGNTGSYFPAHNVHITGSGTVSRCTIVGAGRGVYVAGSAAVAAIDHTIIASSTGYAVSCGSGGTATLTCCNVYGNAHDWEDCIAGQFGGGNISQDPLFCDAESGDFTLSANSPCAAENNPVCGQIGALGVGCGVSGSFAVPPTMISVLDVGNDQGRSVRLRWLRSKYDAPGELFSIFSYEVHRRQGAQLAKKQVQPGSESAVAGVRGESRIDGWDYVETVPAHGDSVYQYVAPTLCDSTADGGICWSAFLIRGTTSDPYVYFDSPPDSGYSVDNLAPAPPAGLLADGNELLVTLTWDDSEEVDFDYYAVYRDVFEDFEPGEPIGFTSEPTYEDTDPPAALEWWYKVAAFDFGGNESDPSLPAGAASTGVTDLVPTVFWLGPAVPNPFNPVTDIHYWVPSDQKPSHVTLIIHDSSGRVVRHLVNGEIPPGVHAATWDGRDDGGSPIASGVYFCRMSAAGFEKVRKITLLK